MRILRTSTRHSLPPPPPPPTVVCMYYIYRHHHSSRARVIRPAQGCHSTCSSLLSNELSYIYISSCAFRCLPTTPHRQDLHLPLHHGSYLPTIYPLYPTILYVELASFCSTPSPHSKPFPLCHCFHLTISFFVYTYPIIGSTPLPPSPSLSSRLRARTWKLRAANFQLLFVFRFYDDILFYFLLRPFLYPFFIVAERSPFHPPRALRILL